MPSLRGWGLSFRVDAMLVFNDLVVPLLPCLLVQGCAVDLKGRHHPWELQIIIGKSGKLALGSLMPLTTSHCDLRCLTVTRSLLCASSLHSVVYRSMPYVLPERSRPDVNHILMSLR